MDFTKIFLVFIFILFFYSVVNFILAWKNTKKEKHLKSAFLGPLFPLYSNLFTEKGLVYRNRFIWSLLLVIISSIVAIVVAGIARH